MFSEAVTGFATGDVSLSGTAGATTAVVSGTGPTYTVTVTGMTAAGTVVATIAAAVCTSVAAGLPNEASTSTDNSVAWQFAALAVGWAHAYWADPSAPEFGALGLANNAAAATWPDEVGTADLSQATSNRRPLYKTAGANLGKPCLAFFASGGQEDYYPPAAYSTIGPTHTVVLLLRDNMTGVDHYYVDGKDSSHRRIVGALGTNVYRHYAGAVADGGTNTAGKKGVRSKIVSGTSDVLTVNGSTVTSASAGDQDLTGLTVCAAYDGTGAFTECEFAFIGVYAGDVTADPGWSDFVAWASAYYGITLS